MALFAKATLWCKTNPKMAAASVAYVAFELSPIGPTGFAYRLPGKMRAAKEKEAASWLVLDAVVPPGFHGGDTMAVENPNTAEPFKCCVPEGKVAGETFKYRVKKQ